jgi:hypothetical protein
MSHGEPCITENQIDQYDRTFSAVFINGHPKGSLMVRMAKIEDEQEHQDEMLKEIKQGIDDLPKKLALWLTILATLIVIFQFLVPSIQKRLNMTELPPSHEISNEAIIPPM